MSNEEQSQIIQLLNDRMDRGTIEMNQVQKEIKSISNNQTKISGDLSHHIQRSDERHLAVLEELAEIRKENSNQLNNFKQALKEHTEEEMEVQRGTNKELQDINKRTTILWFSMGFLGIIASGAVMYYIQKLIDISLVVK